VAGSVKRPGVAAAAAAALMSGVVAMGTGGPARATAALDRPVTAAAAPVRAPLTLVSPASGAVIARVNLGGVPEHIAVPPSGDSAYVTGYMPGSGRLVAYKITPGQRVRVRRIAYSSTATALAISPSGRTLYLADPENPLGPRSMPKIVPVSISTGKSGRPIQVHGVGPYLENLAVDPNNKVIYALGSAATIAAIRVSSGKAIGRPIRIGPRKSPPFTSVERMIFSRSGGLLYVISAEGLRYSLVTVINVRTDRAIGAARVPGGIVSNVDDVAVTPSGRLVYVVSMVPRTGETLTPVSVIRVGSKVTKLRTLSSIGGAMTIAAAPSGRAVYVGGADYGASEVGQLTAIPTATSTPSRPVTVAEDTPNDIVISRDSATAYLEEGNDEVYPVSLKTDVVGPPIVAGPVTNFGYVTGGMALTGNGQILYIIGVTAS
jgi:hypothetical protein